jgi:hypothetical protein
MRFVTRKEWGSRDTNPPTNITPERGGVTVHYAGDPSPDLSSHDGCHATWRGSQRYHMDTRGYADIAYNLGACIHGYVFEGRGVRKRSGANGAEDPRSNQDWYAIQAMIGPANPVTDELLSALVDGIEYLRDKGGAATKVNGHRDHKSTECPGDKLYAWVRAGAKRPTTKEIDDMPYTEAQLKFIVEQATKPLAAKLDRLLAQGQRIKDLTRLGRRAAAAAAEEGMTPEQIGAQVEAALTRALEEGAVDVNVTVAGRQA